MVKEFYPCFVLSSSSSSSFFFFFRPSNDMMYELQFEKSLPEETNLGLVDSVQKNTRRYIDILSQAVDDVMPKETKELTYAN